MSLGIACDIDGVFHTLSIVAPGNKAKMFLVNGVPRISEVCNTPNFEELPKKCFAGGLKRFWEGRDNTSRWYSTHLI